MISWNSEDTLGSFLKHPIIIGLILLFFSGALMTGCATWEGFGKDVENAGEKIQGKEASD